jgi:hypothetical protein
MIEKAVSYRNFTTSRPGSPESDRSALIDDEVCISMFIYVYLHVCMYICLYMFVCMYLYVYTYIIGQVFPSLIIVHL